MVDENGRIKIHITTVLDKLLNIYGRYNTYISMVD